MPWRARDTEGTHEEVLFSTDQFGDITITVTHGQTYGMITSPMAIDPEALYVSGAAVRLRTLTGENAAETAFRIPQW